MKENLKYYLRRNGLAYITAEALYENWLYLPLMSRHVLSTLALRAGMRGVRRATRQAVLTWPVAFPRCDRPADLVAWFRSGGVEVSEGGHTFYIAPQASLARLIPEVVDFYPDGAGFKVLRDLREPARARYIYKHPRSLRMLKTLIGTPHDQLIVANYMHTLGIGPRVWDVCCWSAPGTRCTVFVVDHVTGREPTIGQSNRFLARLSDLNRHSQLRILVPHWQRTMDFQPPDCNDNLVYSDALGRLQYVDFQNFGLKDRAAGWRHEVATVRREKDLSAFAPALRRAPVDLRGRLVLHIGCGEGAMMRSALAAGAAWTLGWDEAGAMAQTEARLLAHGCARFTLTAARLDDDYPVQDDIPGRLQHLLPDAVVFCTTSGGPPASVFEMPWNVLVWQGSGSDEAADARGRFVSAASAHGIEVDVVATGRGARAGAPGNPVVLLRRTGRGPAAGRNAERNGEVSGAEQSA